MGLPQSKCFEDCYSLVYEEIILSRYHSTRLSFCAMSKGLLFYFLLTDLGVRFIDSNGAYFRENNEVVLFLLQHSFICFKETSSWINECLL